MGRVFVKQSDAIEHTDFTGKSFADIVAIAQKEVPGLTWQELALYNWGTREPNAVNRALVERIGCRTVDDTDPGNTRFDPALGPGSAKIFLPKIWKTDRLDRNRTHTITVKRRPPSTAVSIVTLSQWFIPKTEACAIEYRLEGATSQADKVDFEVHVAGYVEEQSGGATKPSSTQAEAGTTHIQRKRVLEITTPEPPSGPQAINGWKGECEVAKGVLRPKGGGTGYLSYRFAPYDVVLRYYKAKGDEKARILLEPFVPVWKTPSQIDESSLVVKWTIHDDNDKLTLGQLVVYNGKDVPVLRVGLNKARLRSEKKYDLAADLKQKRIAFNRNEGPYRVQIQAHSDASVAEGLAVAVMHTEVKPFVYDQARLIGFNIKPGTKPAQKTPPRPATYLGDANDDTDITARCEVMKAAIRTAYEREQTLDPKSTALKIFMAPEFYFRGANGGYHLDKLFTIAEQMRAETDRFEYADWLFVLGTAIGYVPHEDEKTGQRVVYGGGTERPAEILEVDGTPAATIRVECSFAARLHQSVQRGVVWKVKQGAMEAEVAASAREDVDKCRLTLKSKQSFAAGPVVLVEPVAWVLESRSGSGGTEVKVCSSVGARIPLTVGKSATVSWTIQQSGSKAVAIAESVYEDDDVYWLSLRGKQAFTPGPVQLSEPVTTEIYNVALVQKGWPAAALRPKTALTAAAVYKEYISPIDFLRPDSDADFHKAGGTERRIDIHGSSDRIALPVSGSRDLLGASPNEPGKGVIWRDSHGEEHVVGSEINKSGYGGASVFTIDGVTFGLEVCLDHAQNRLANYYAGAAKAGDPKVQIQLIPSWGMSIGGGKLCVLSQGLVFNVDGARIESTARTNDGRWSCDVHPDQMAGSAGHCPVCKKGQYYYICTACNTLMLDTQPTPCFKCGTVTADRVYQCSSCKGWFAYPPPSSGACGSCGSSKLTMADTKDQPFQRLGTTLVPADTADVDLSGLSEPWTKYFERKEKLVVYPVHAIPAAESV